jgi:hypothetical protein
MANTSLDIEFWNYRDYTLNNYSPHQVYYFKLALLRHIYINPDFYGYFLSCQ